MSRSKLDDIKFAILKRLDAFYKAFPLIPDGYEVCAKLHYPDNAEKPQIFRQSITMGRGWDKIRKEIERLSADIYDAITDQVIEQPYHKHIGEEWFVSFELPHQNSIGYSDAYSDFSTPEEWWENAIIAFDVEAEPGLSPRGEDATIYGDIKRVDC